MIQNKRESSRLVLMLTGLFLASTAAAQLSHEDGPDKQKTRQAQAVSKKVYDAIQDAQQKVSEEDYQAALSRLTKLNHSDRLTEYERSNVLNNIGLTQYTMGNTAAAIATFEEMLRLENLEVQIRKKTLYTLAQLSTVVDNFDDALRHLESWFAVELNPTADAYILLAQVLYEAGRHEDMIGPIETAIEIASQGKQDVKENWYVLLNFAYFKKEDFEKVQDIQKILLASWPKPHYWFTLAGAFTELGDEKGLLTSYDIAYMQDLLKQESQLLTMAQLYLQHEVPYRSALLLETEMNNGSVSRNARNYRLLSQAWSLAQEDERAIPALIQAASLSEDGELDLRLGNAYLNLGRYSDCVEAVHSALQKGNLKNPANAQISLGMCFYNQQEFGSARIAFEEANKFSNSTRILEQWINVIDADIARIEQISLAESAAQIQLQELRRRRQTANGI